MSHPIPAPAECYCGNCYGCKRRAIDEMALYIYAREMRICAGMMTEAKLHEHAAAMCDHYRHNAINALAFETF